MRSSLQKDRLLAHIASAVFEAERLRRTSYESKEIVGTEILWECLFDPSDEKLLSSLVHYAEGRADNELDRTATNIRRVIHLKTNLLRHVLELVSTPNYADNDLTESRFRHCLKHSCLLMDCIASLRRTIIAHHNPVRLKIDARSGVIRNTMPFSYKCIFRFLEPYRFSITSGSIDDVVSPAGRCCWMVGSLVSNQELSCCVTRTLFGNVQSMFRVVRLRRESRTQQVYRGREPLD